MRWANGKDNTYRVGCDGAYDLEYAPGSHPQHPHTLLPWDAAAECARRVMLTC